MPHDSVRRHPFAGPGRGVSILGEVKAQNDVTLRAVNGSYKNFVQKLCGCGGGRTVHDLGGQQAGSILGTLGDMYGLAAASGGGDSSMAAAPGRRQAL